MCSGATRADVTRDRVSRIPSPAAPVPVVMGWSGGKDSALALHALGADPMLRVQALVTTLTDPYNRISMHGVRHRLLAAQAAAIGLPLTEARIAAGASNADYEAAFAAALASHRARGVRQVAFGDLFLADIRAYRERQLAALDMTARFPLWERDTAALAREFIALGFRARLVCIDPKRLDASFAGRPFDATLLADLPPGVDPCGENGEFHTFVTDGPIFDAPVQCVTGEVVTRDGFVFCDLIASPASVSGTDSYGARPARPDAPDHVCASSGQIPVGNRRYP
jgi:uncharacterized protein (TIGR00290 family)